MGGGSGAGVGPAVFWAYAAVPMVKKIVVRKIVQYLRQASDRDTLSSKMQEILYTNQAVATCETGCIAVRATTMSENKSYSVRKAVIGSIEAARRACALQRTLHVT